MHIKSMKGNDARWRYGRVEGGGNNAVYKKASTEDDDDDEWIVFDCLGGIQSRQAFIVAVMERRKSDGGRLTRFSCCIYVAHRKQ